MRLRQVVLHLEDVGDLPLIRLRPEQRVVGHAGELRRQPQPIAGTPHAPGQDEAHAQPGADLRQRHVLATEGECRRARNDAQAREAGQIDPISSSVIPSLKKSLALSPPTLAKGRIASESARVGLTPVPAPRVARPDGARAAPRQSSPSTASDASGCLRERALQRRDDRRGDVGAQSRQSASAIR